MDKLLPKTLEGDKSIVTFQSPEDTTQRRDESLILEKDMPRKEALNNLGGLMSIASFNPYGCVLRPPGKSES
jgi:hypothetical protein